MFTHIFSVFMLVSVKKPIFSSKISKDFDARAESQRKRKALFDGLSEADQKVSFLFD